MGITQLEMFFELLKTAVALLIITLLGLPGLMIESNDVDDVEFDGVEFNHVGKNLAIRFEL